jgi:release factor glutamine methyltransferase
LVEEVTGEAWPASLDLPVTERARRRFEALVERRGAGEPLQYVIGRWPFRTLDLMVDRRVLIPRPETERVVEVALAELDRLDARPAVVVDLGTGSGAIALSVAAERPSLVSEVWATDCSLDALAVASANLAGLGGSAAARVRLAHGWWWDALPPSLRERVDMVIANPPYISTDEMGRLDTVVTGWEPKAALEAGSTGLEAIEHILTGAPAWLAGRATVVLEIAPHQSGPAAARATSAGFDHVEVRPDLAGRDRVLVARR